jgi:hypothetical protein
MHVHRNYPQPLADQASELGSSGTSSQVAQSWRVTATRMRSTAAMEPPQKVKVGPHRHQRGGNRNRYTMGVRRAAWHMAGNACHWLRPSVLVQPLRKSIVQWLKPFISQAEVDWRAHSFGFHDVDHIDHQVPSARLNWTYTNLYDNTAPASGYDASASNSEQERVSECTHFGFQRGCVARAPVFSQRIVIRRTRLFKFGGWCT